MKLSEKGRAMLIELEGKRNHVYEDVAGLKTIGVGHLLKPDEEMAYLTDDQVDELLTNDLKTFERLILGAVIVKINQAQFDALVIFSFNVGARAFMRSTLLKKLNSKDYDGAAEQFMRWNKAGGKAITGLTNRRRAEVKLFEGVA